MRVLKFRAWDKTNKKMLDRVLAGPGDPCSLAWSEGKGWNNFDDDCGEIMQFTGLLDKNGKEIYDGDIVQTGQAKERGIARPFVGRIYWFDHEFQWWVTDDTKDSVDGIDYDITFLRSYQDVEVIGNIYEHLCSNLCAITWATENAAREGNDHESR